MDFPVDSNVGRTFSLLFGGPSVDIDTILFEAMCVSKMKVNKLTSSKARKLFYGRLFLHGLDLRRILISQSFEIFCIQV